MPVESSELLQQVHFTGEARCDGFRPHPLRPSFCTECNKLFDKHRPELIPNDDCLLDAIAHTQKSEKSPDLILPAVDGSGGLYLGGYKGVMNHQFLQDAKITHIVNTAKDLHIFGPKYVSAVQKAKNELGIHFLELNWEDTESFYITNEDIRTCCLFIHKARQDGHSVLVHCAQGKSRSSTAVIGYIMTIQVTSFNDAMSFVQSRHKMAQPNPMFIKRLQEFEKSDFLSQIRKELQ